MTRPTPGTAPRTPLAPSRSRVGGPAQPVAPSGDARAITATPGAALATCAWCARLHRGGPEACLWGWVLVCGGRAYADRQRVFATLDRLAQRLELFGVRHGAGSGADALAGLWAQEPRVVCVVALPGGSGTADMVARATEAGLPVWRVG